MKCRRHDRPCRGACSDCGVTVYPLYASDATPCGCALAATETRRLAGLKSLKGAGAIAVTVVRRSPHPDHPGDRQLTCLACGTSWDEVVRPFDSYRRDEGGTLVRVAR